MNARNTTKQNLKNNLRTNTGQIRKAGWNLTALAYRPGTTVRGWAILSLICLSATAANAELVMRIDGTVTPSFSQVDFGDVPVGESRQIVVALRNEGADDIIFSENPPIILGGSFPDQFELIQPALESGNKLSPNGSTAFAIRCEPTIEFANLTCQMFIFTSLAATPERLTFRAAGVTPKMEVDVDGTLMTSSDEIDLGEVEEGTTATTTVTLTNTGTAPLTILSLDLDGDDLFTTTGPQNTTIAPNASESFDVTYTANGSEADATVMTMVTNDTSVDANGEFLLLFTASTLAVEEEVIVDPNENEVVDNDDDNGNDDEAVNDDPNNEQDEQDIADQNGNDDEQLNDDELNNEQNDDELDNDEQLDDEMNGNDEDYEDNLEEFEPIAPIGCGCGLGFCSLASMISIGAVKGRRRLKL